LAGISTFSAGKVFRAPGFDRLKLGAEISSMRLVPCSPDGTADVDGGEKEVVEMRFVHPEWKGGEARSTRVVRPTALALVAALAVFVGWSGTALAAPTSDTAAAGGFCGLAKGVASTAVDPSAQLTPTSASYSLASLESKIKIAFEKVESEEPALIAASPSPVKGDLQKIFAVDNLLIADLKKANWNFVALAADEKTLEAAEAEIKPAIASLDAYFKSECGIKVP
jgi:hypothetical protein